MLLSLEIDNLGCFADTAILDLPVAANVPAEEGRFASPLAGLRVPKVVVLFGPNASGKTTVLRAISVLAHFVQSSVDRPLQEPILVQPFQDDEWSMRPTRIAVEFIGTLVTETPCRYRYALAVRHDPDQQRVVLNEALSYAPHARMRRLFERNGQTIRGSREFELTDHDVRLGTIRPNASVVSTLAKLNHAVSRRIVEALNAIHANVFIHRFEVAEEEATRHYVRNPDSLSALNTVLPALDIGISGVRIIQGERGPLAVFQHAGLRGPIPLFYESGGTKRLFAVLPLIERTLASGGLALLDEIDTELHPTLLPDIIRWFHDPQRNPHDAQLIATCHNPYLLEHLDKTEIWFTEKDSGGRASLFGLRDIQGVRRNDNFYRKYMDGAFGAIPQLG